MVLFWLIVALLIAATLAMLLLPLFKRRAATDGPDPDAATTAVYRDQKQALEAEYADGIISAQEREAAVNELSHRLGEEVGHEPRPGARMLERKSVWMLAAVLLVVIPSAAIFLYSRLGQPDAVVASAPETGSHDISDKQVAALVDTLAQRLRTRPDDVEGWVLLARSYNALGRYPEAADAYGHAVALVPDDPQLLADYADVLAMSQGKKLAGKPTELAQKALSIDPNHRKSLALAATAAMEVHDYDGAIALWQRLRVQFPEGSEDAARMNAIIAEVQSMKGDSKTSPPVAKVPAAPQRAAAAPAAPSRQAAASAPSAGAGPGPAIAGRVDIKPELAAKVALTDTVFIFARAADGPRMPLAALRVPAKQLPMDFRLDDSMGMGMGPKLSGASSVIVEARISKSGTAVAQAGDLSGKSAAVKPGASGVNITIDQVVQ